MVYQTISDKYDFDDSVLVKTMVAIPEKVLNLLGDKDAVKILVTAGKGGRPHAIVCGTIISPAPDMMAVGEVLMHRASKNLDNNAKSSFLVVKGMESYEINCCFKERQTAGPLYDAMKAQCDAMKLPLAAVRVFQVCCVCDEGAGPNAGKKIA